MQNVSETFKSNAIARNRKPTAQLAVSWLRNYAGANFFTIGVSTIGGPDVIKGENNTIAESDRYEYYDESNYLMSIEIDRWIEEPIFSVVRGLCDFIIENNSGRFTPGLDPEIGSGIKSRRPVRAYIGFNYNGIANNIQQFIGIIAENAKVDNVNNTATLHGIDFMAVLWDYPVEETALYQDKRSDELIEILLQSAGLTAGQYVLDEGLVTVPFAFFEKGQKLGDIINKICQAEQAIFRLDENGVFRFENRIHWLSAPYTVSQIELTDDLVIKQESPAVEKIVNVVQITAKPRAVVGTDESIFDLPDTREIAPGQTIEVWATYENPIFSFVEPTGGVGATSYYTANAASNGSGTDKTAQVDLVMTNFSTTSKLEFTNNDASTVYLTELIIFGKPAKISQELYLRVQDDTSIAEYDERSVSIENDFLQSYATIKSIATSIIANRKNPGDYRTLTVRGLPHLQLGDLVTREGATYFIIRIKTRFTAADGLIQELTMVNRTVSPIS